MPIHPLPQFESDLKAAEADRLAYAKLKAPKSIVVRFGVMKLVGEFPYDGDAKPGCGSKLIVRTFRGTELGEMLTSTCPNAGCSKSVTRKEMLEYIENSGGREYPFFTEGRVVRVATAEDLDRQARLEQSRHGMKLQARAVAEQHAVPLKIVEVEPILGGERLTVYYASEQRVEFRDFVRALSQELHGRIDMRQVGARDEARLTADYERCGQYCCCKNFLKVLKPVSMKSAKVQKATLDPLKISGRCGRLMCCLRYEDQTYTELAARLPRRKQRVGTPEGDGWVVDSQILTQLVLVQLEREDKQVAVPVEDLKEPGGPPPPRVPEQPPRDDRSGGGPPDRRRPGPPRHDRPQRPESRAEPRAEPRAHPPEPAARQEDPAQPPPVPADEASGQPPAPDDEGHRRRRRRRRRRRGPEDGQPPPGPPPPQH